MPFQIIMPARINILGNPSDAVEGAHQTISGAIDLHAGVFFEESDDLFIEFLEKDEGEKFFVKSSLKFASDKLTDYGSEADLVVAAISRLKFYSDELREKFKQE